MVGTLDLIERDGDGRVVVVGIKTSARKYTDLQVEPSLQLSTYRSATAMNGHEDQEDLGSASTCCPRPSSPELCRYWTRDRAASVRLFRLAVEVLHAIEAGVPAERAGVAVTR